MTSSSEDTQMADMEQALKGLDAISAVNLDEIVIDTLSVKVRVYKDVDVLDDDGDPVLGDDGKPQKYRKAGIRTARIQSMVPMSLYNEMIALEGKMDKSNPAAALTMMADFVLKIWQISEPFMTQKMLMEGLEGPYIVRIFRLFFGKAVKQMSQRGA